MTQNVMKPWLMGYLEGRATFALSGDRTPGTDKIFMFSRRGCSVCSPEDLDWVHVPGPPFDIQRQHHTLSLSPFPFGAVTPSSRKHCWPGHGSVSDQSGLFSTQVTIYFSNGACAQGKAIGEKVER